MFPSGTFLFRQQKVPCIMTIYDFIASKEECHKLTSPRMTATALVGACSLLENIGDRAVEIRMNQMLFSKFVCNAFSQKMENSIYERTIRSMRFMNAGIVIDNSIEDPVVIVNGKKNDGMSVVKIFIG